MKKASSEEQPALVSSGTIQAGDGLRSRWPFAEPTIWTDRMLTALEEGVQGGKWFSLIDKAFSLRSLGAAFAKVKSNHGAHGVDGVTIARFEKDLEGNLERLHMELRAGSYRPRPVRRVWIPKPGTKEKRALGIPTIRDRVVQTSLKNCLEPIFEKEFRDCSFGFRPGRSCHKALSRVWRSLQSGSGYVVDADLQRFFDTIPHEHIMQGVSERISDGRILELVGLLLRQGVMDGWTWDPSDDEGTPQGSVISPLLANIALHGLDQLAESQGCALVRYADDFVAICGTQEQAEAALSAFSGWCAGHGLSLHPDKTRIVAYGAGESFDFLGFTFKQGKYFPRKKSFQNLRNKVRSHTPRNSGRSLSQMLNDLNPMLRGWYGYFKVCSPAQLAQGDQFVRRRLRCILSRRLGKRGMRSLSSNCRWSIAYFASQGLFSMEEARRTALSEVNR